jgi:hypothetical protein
VQLTDALDAAVEARLALQAAIAVEAKALSFSEWCVLSTLAGSESMSVGQTSMQKSAKSLLKRF